MKILQSHLLRALVTIVTGTLIIKYREETVQWLTIAIGVLFFLSGIISCAVWWNSRQYYSKEFSTDSQQLADKSRQARASVGFPIVGLGSIILGIILAIMPSTFITGLMYILASLIILGAINQYVNLVMARRWCDVGWFYWVLPTVTLLVSIVIIFKPIEIAASPLLIIGWCMILYGVAECLNAVKLYRARKFFEAAKVVSEGRIVVDAELLEQADGETPAAEKPQPDSETPKEED